jgi:hypothetical protein
MAVIATITDIRAFSAEHLTFGKLVEDHAGAIARAAESEVTSASTGLDRWVRPTLSPQFLTNPEPWEPSDLCANSRLRGALLVRPVQLAASGPFHMAAARIRYRPEAGERMAGRVTAQSSARIFGLVDWLRNAAFVADQILPALEARPDLARRRAHERLFEPPLAFRPRLLTDTPVSSVPSGVWLIIDALAEGRSCHLGTETFGSEAAFLQGMARVFDLLDETAPHGLTISWTAGYRPPDPRYAVQYFPDRAFPSRSVAAPLVFRDAQGRGEHWRRFAARIRDACRGEATGRHSASMDQDFRTLQKGMNTADGDNTRSFIPARISCINSLLADSSTRQEGEAELAEFVKAFRLLFPSELENLAGLTHVAGAVTRNVAAGDREFADFLEASRQIIHMITETGGDADILRCCETVLAGAIARLAHGELASVPIFAAACRQLALRGRDHALNHSLAALTDLAAAPVASREGRTHQIQQLRQIADAARAGLAAADLDRDGTIPCLDGNHSDAGAICDAPLVPTLATHQETVRA